MTENELKLEEVLADYMFRFGITEKARKLLLNREGEERPYDEARLHEPSDHR